MNSRKSAAKIGLSTASVYPESTASCFELAARLGYDGVELMVGIDPLSTQIDAVKRLVDYHQLPVIAIHAPCLLITQRVWGTDPWGKLERSAEAAKKLGADVVVVHPPFRWQRDYARGFVEGIARLEAETGDHLRGREHVPVARAGQGSAGVRAELGSDRADVRAHHAGPVALVDRRAGLRRAGGDDGQARSSTSTSPTAPARRRTSTWCPGVALSVLRICCKALRTRTSAVTSSSRSTPVAAPAGPSARST